MRKVLILSYYFPPAGGSGAHRPWAMARHLPEYGYEPIVLTAGPEWHEGAATEHEPDEALAGRIVRTPADRHLRAYRRRSAIRALNMQRVARVAEARGIWFRSAMAHARELLKSEPVGAILTSAPPYAVTLAGARLRKMTGLPWVADFRDPWPFGLVNPWLGGVGYLLDKALFMRSAKRASAVIMNTPTALSDFRRAAPRLAAEKAVCITNGFRPVADTGSVSSSDGLLRVAHVGVFYWNESMAQGGGFRRAIADALSYVPDRVDRSAHSAGFLLRALRKAIDARPALAEIVRVTLVGQLHPPDRALIERLGLGGVVEATGHLPWKEANAHAAAADVLYLPFWRSASGRRIPRVPSKTYEYLASGKPVLAVVDDGDAKDFLERAGVGILCQNFSEDALAATLDEVCRRHQEGRLGVTPDREFISQFSWPSVVKRIADVLDRAIDGPPSSGEADG